MSAGHEESGFDQRRLRCGRERGRARPGDPGGESGDHDGECADQDPAARARAARGVWRVGDLVDHRVGFEVRCWLGVEELGEFGRALRDELLDRGWPRRGGRADRFEKFGGGGVFRETPAKRLGNRGLRREQGTEREQVVVGVFGGRAGDDPGPVGGEPDVGGVQASVGESGAVELGQVGCDSGGQPHDRRFGQRVGDVLQRGAGVEFRSVPRRGRVRISFEHRTQSGGLGAGFGCSREGERNESVVRSAAEQDSGGLVPGQFREHSVLTQPERVVDRRSSHQLPPRKAVREGRSCQVWRAGEVQAGRIARRRGHRRAGSA